VILAHKIALDPNNKQATYFAKACGVARLTYNFGLAEWNEQYAAGGKPSSFSLDRYFNSVKDVKFPFVREVTKCAPKIALMNLGTAFKNFFAKRAKYPQFKKKGVHDAFELDNDSFRIDGQKINVPRLGWVRMREALRFVGKIMSATISRTAGRWFVSIAVEMPDKSVAKHEGPAVGIDFGCTNFATLSTGEQIAGPKPHKVMLNRLRRLSKSLSRKVKGSNNRNKAKHKLAKLHARIANIRKDFLHKFTTDICRRFSLIGIEDLNVSGMTKNHSLARSILDQAPSEMRRQLTYKAPMHGSVLSVANRWFPSTKLCNICGNERDSLSLSVRTWICTCGAVHDRDDNASQNLKQNAVSSTVSACGAGSAGVVRNNNVKLPAMKQELNITDASG
jgi:putative transposase